MLALRLTRGAHPAVQLRRLLVATASAGTGFLLLCALGHALGHPGDPEGSLLRLAWCMTPLAATVYFAVAVARTDPATRPRPGLSAIGLGPTRLMVISATTTALSTTLGSMLALLFFLHLRGDLTGMPFDGAAAGSLAAGAPLPVPAVVTLLTWVPVTASTAAALALRPRTDGSAPLRATPRSFGRFGAYGGTAVRETFGAYVRFGSHLRPTASTGEARRADGGTRRPAENQPVEPARATPARTGAPSAPDTGTGDRGSSAPSAPDTGTGGPSPLPPPPADAPRGLPWGIAVLAAGLAVEAYATRSATPAPAAPLPGDPAGAPAVLLGWALTALGLVLAGPGLTHLCGRLLQTARPGAIRLLAGRVLMTEATRLGRPLGVVCAVASGAYAMPTVYDTTGAGATNTAAATAAPAFGPLTALGLLLVTGCTVATLLTAAVEAKHARADTTAALQRLGAPATMLRGAAALRAAALLALFGPLTLLVAELAALPLAR